MQRHYKVRIVKNDYLNILCFIINMPAIFNVTSVLANQFGISSSVITALFYIGILGYIVLTCRIKVRDVGLLLSLYAIFAANYVLFPLSRQYIVADEMVIIYAFILPYCVFVVKNIRNWDGFFSCMEKYTIPVIALAAFMLTFLNYEKYLIYMGFSYSLLPAICTAYYSWKRNKSQKTKSKLQFIYAAAYIIGLAEIFVFGSRAAILYAVFYVIIFEVTRIDTTRIRKSLIIISLCCVAATIAVLFETILQYLSSIPAFRGSYLLSRALEGELFESIERNQIQVICFNRIKEMGLSFSGFFGDRPYMLAGYAYPHNIFLEILMSLGWVVGLSVIVWMASLGVRAAAKKSIHREIAFFVLLTMLAKFMISGSYLTDGKFWLSIFVLISIKESKKVPQIKKVLLSDADRCVEVRS